MVTLMQASKLHTIKMSLVKVINDRRLDNVMSIKPYRQFRIEAERCLINLNKAGEASTPWQVPRRNRL